RDNPTMALGDSFYKTSPIKVKGHGERKENKYVWNKCDKWLNLWLDERVKDGIECDYLFCRKEENGGWEQILITTANSYAKTLSLEFNFPVYLHSLRHLLVSELERAGLPMTVSQFLLGHSNLSVTELYNDVPKDEALGQFNDFFSGKTTDVTKKGLGDL
ncbi:MAG: site-specific integrase, partial [Cetobacterium sp.]